MQKFLSQIKDIFYSERDRWFSFVPVLFGLGIGVYFSLSFEPSIWITLGVIEAVLILAFLFRFSKPKLLLLLIFFIVLAGFANIQLKAHYLAKNYKTYNNEKLYLNGRIKNIDANYRGMPRVLLDNLKDYNDDSLPGNIRISLMSKKYSPQINTCVETIAVLRPPLEPVMVGGYQFSRKYFFEGITAIGYAASRLLPIECKKEQGFSDNFAAYIFDLRMKVVKNIDEIMPKNEAAITSALVAGERGGISQDLYNNYRDSGLAHFLSISGLHMSMVAGLMFFLVRFLIALVPPLALHYDSKRIASVFAIIMSFVYLLISGAEIPAQRAFIMTLIVLVGVLVSRIAISMKTISWAAMIILAVSPQVIIGPSFQMSFAAVVCLIAFYEKCSGSLRNFLNNNSMPWILKVIFIYIAGILVSDLIASLATLPFTIYHFNRVALYTTLGNFLAGPIIGLIIMPFVLIALLLMPLGLEAIPLKIVGFGVGLVNDITAYVSSIPDAGYQVLAMPLWGLVLIAAGGLWLCIWQKRWRHLGWIGIIIGALSMAWVRSPDVIVGEDTFAVRDNFGNMVVMPVRGTSFEKKIWLEKTASKVLDTKQQQKLKKIFDGKAIDKVWVDMSCDKLKCDYKGLVLNKKELGNPRSIWLPSRVITVEEYVGRRLWSN